MFQICQVVRLNYAVVAVTARLTYTLQDVGHYC